MVGQIKEIVGNIIKDDQAIWISNYLKLNL
jgi:hypothetical protein